jgi:signal transduction histidine kinase
MRKTTGFLDVVRLIRFAAILWIAYLAALGIISQSFRDPRQGNAETIYYFMLGAIAFLCLGLVFWPWIQERLGRAFIPLMITIIVGLPIIATWVIFAYFPHGPNFNSESMVLRLLPFLLVGFLLVAWRYKWQYFLLIILAISGFNIGIIWSFSAPGTPPNSPFFRGAFVVPVIQTVVFLAVGFSISYLMSRLRKQQQSLEEANKNLTHYASTLEHLSVSQERNRLARELHDTLAHALSGLSVQLETMKAYWDVDQQTARSILDKSLTAAHSGLEETRRALKALRASPLDDLGLSLAISEMVKDAASRSNLILNLSIMDKIPSLSPDVEQCIYRVAQEAITNVVNHAKAKHITVNLQYIEGKMKLTVSDDGIGFDLNENAKSNRFGLKGMRERAQIVGGELNVISQAGSGSTVQLTV